MSGQVLYSLLIGLVAVERLGELAVSRRNAAWCFARGGVEYGQEQYPFMVALHTGLLVGCVVEVWLVDPTFRPALWVPMLALVVAAQLLRWWCIGTLGHRWNTRVIVVPGMPPVRRGPYRRLDHPNYLAVVVEGIALPLVGDAWVTALLFTVLNLPLLAVRIRVENAALAAAAAQ